MYEVKAGFIKKGRRTKPLVGEVCVICGQSIFGFEYHYSKSRGGGTAFIHHKCWNELPKFKGGDAN